MTTKRIRLQNYCCDEIKNVVTKNERTRNKSRTCLEGANSIEFDRRNALKNIFEIFFDFFHFQLPIQFMFWVKHEFYVIILFS